MFRDLFSSYGWSDRVGPLWFLKPRWTCGPRWRPAWGRYFASPHGVTLQAHVKKGGYALGGVFIPALLWNDLSYAQKETVVMSWVSRMRRPGAEGGGPPPASDPEWMRNLPALHEYLTLVSHDDGAERRTATLTVFVDSGSWKSFLNDRDSGCSLCASGPTVADTLSALEVMLEGENPPWRLSGRDNGPTGKKRKQGS